MRKRPRIIINRMKMEWKVKSKTKHKENNTEQHRDTEIWRGVKKD